MPAEIHHHPPPLTEAMMRSVDMARAHEIMARYRPIAPRPPVSCNLIQENPPPLPLEKAAGLHIPTRTSRARKRGRGACSCVSQKRAKTFYSVLPPPVDASLPSTTCSLQGFNLHGFPLLPFPGSGFQGKFPEKTTSSGELLSLSLLSSPSPTPSLFASEHAKETTNKELDLNCEPETTLVEKDLLQNLTKTIVIVPQPVRPIGSSISVGCISEGKAPVPQLAAVSKKPEEVEEEVESDDLPAVVSDSNNRVRLANSAYKEMVGQPECSWLDSMVTSVGAGPKAPSKRINGEVMLDLANSSVPVPAHGFSCRVKIEWACNGRKSYVNAPCDVIRLACESKDYFFTWRFHTSTEAFDNSCKA